MSHRLTPLQRSRPDGLATLFVSLRANGRTAAISIWFITLAAVAIYGAAAQASQAFVALLLAGLVAFSPRRGQGRGG